jgi:hypothetical protein
MFVARSTVIARTSVTAENYSLTMQWKGLLTC